MTFQVGQQSQISLNGKGPYSAYAEACDKAGNCTDSNVTDYSTDATIKNATGAKFQNIYVPPAQIDITDIHTTAGPGGYAKVALLKITPSEIGQSLTTLLSHWNAIANIAEVTLYKASDSNGTVANILQPDWHTPPASVNVT